MRAKIVLVFAVLVFCGAQNPWTARIAQTINLFTQSPKAFSSYVEQVKTERPIDKKWPIPESRDGCELYFDQICVWYYQPDVVPDEPVRWWNLPPVQPTRVVNEECCGCKYYDRSCDEFSGAEKDDCCDCKDDNDAACEGKPQRRSLQTSTHSIEYQCFDSLTSLINNKAETEFPTCSRIGRWLHGTGTDVFTDLEFFMDTVSQIPRPQLQWSSELELSASLFLKDMEGCPSLYHQIDRPLDKYHYISEIATFSQYHRIILYPFTYKWESEEEMVFDMIMDDYYMDHPNRKALFSGLYTQIGIACSCHPSFEEVCVVELGHEVELKSINEELDSEYYGWRNLMEMPQLKQKGDPTCVKNFTGPYCANDYDWDGDTKWESWQFGTTQEIVNNMFLTIQNMRWNLTEFESTPDGDGDGLNDLLNYYAVKKIHMYQYETGEESLPQWSWSESLAWAARHVLNEEGACNTQGSHYAETFEEALHKYYTYEVENLEYLVLESPHFGGEYTMENSNKWEVDYSQPAFTNVAGYTTLNYIFSQNKIDPSLFFSKTAKHFGIGCACVSSSAPLPVYRCIFATATKLKGRNIKERLPIFQALLNPFESCYSRCLFQPYAFELDPMNDSDFSELMVDWLPGFYSNSLTCGGVVDWDDLYENESPLEYVDKSGFCTTCHEKQYGCAACVTQKFQSNQEECWTCKVQNGRYKNHYYPSTKYNPPDPTDYYEAYNYLMIFDSQVDYEVDVYNDYDTSLDHFKICTVTDCDITSVPLKCTDECLDYDTYYETYFYMNTYQHNLISLLVSNENLAPQANVYFSSSKNWAINTILNPYLETCVEKCEDDSGHWMTPDDYQTEDDSECVCQPGYHQLDDGSCFDCSLIDEDCFECDGIKCTGCVDDNQYVDLVNETYCQEKVENCIIDIGLQPLGFINANKLFPQLGSSSTIKSCPACVEGYTFSPTAAEDFDFRCIDCSEFMDNCLHCETASHCTKCEDGMFVSYDWKSCLENFEFCDISSAGYANNGTHYYCQACLEGFYFDFETMNCEQCYLGCDTCSDFNTCLTCWDSNEIVYPDGSCDAPLEGCLQDPDTYWVVNGSFICDQCDLLKVFWPEAEACVECKDAMAHCDKCSDLTICDVCEAGYWLNADMNKCWTETEFKEYYEEYIGQGCYGMSVEDYVIVVDDEDEFSDEYFYGCMTCEEGYWLEDLKCYDCKTIDPFCKTCSDEEICESCEATHLIELEDLEDKDRQCIPKFTNCKEVGEVTNGDGYRKCQVCNDFFYFDDEAQDCRPCQPGCKVCAKDDELICSETLTNFITNGTHVAQNSTYCPTNNEFKFIIYLEDKPYCRMCDDHEFFNKEKKACVSCTEKTPFCWHCDVDGECIECNDGLYMNMSQPIPTRCHVARIPNCYVPDPVNSAQCSKCYSLWNVNGQIGHFSFQLTDDWTQCVECEAWSSGCVQCQLNERNEFVKCLTCRSDLIHTVVNETYSTCEMCPVGKGYSFDTKKDICVKCDGFNHKSWESCGSCTVDNSSDPLDCTSCLDKKQLIAHAGDVYPKHQCGYVLPNNCLELRPEKERAHECLRCKAGFFLFKEQNECRACDDFEHGGVEKCKVCNYTELIDNVPVVQCKECETPFVLTHHWQDMEFGIGRDVCDWSVRVRAKNCKYSDLEDNKNCLVCQEGFFYDETARSCIACSSKLEGCDKCNEDATECDICLPGFDLKHNSNECWIHHCQSWMGSSDKCAQCLPGWLLQYDTGLCVKECDLLIYQIDKNNPVCWRICDFETEYSDWNDYHQCHRCNEGPAAIDNCLRCSQNGEQINCLECTKPLFFNQVTHKCEQIGCQFQRDDFSCHQCDQDHLLLHDLKTCVLQCPPNYVVYEDIGICGQKCKPNQYARHNDKVCMNCSDKFEGATKCSYDQNNVLLIDSCQSGYVSHDRTQCQKCSFTQYDDGESCIDCNQVYGEYCNVCDQNTCIECEGEIPVIDGMCQCDESRFIDQEKLKCVPCTQSKVLDHCLQCSDDENFCFLCEIDFKENKVYYLNEDYKCVENMCRTWDENGLCIECNEDPTGETLYFEYDTCVYQCSENFELIDETCQLNCPIGTYAGEGKCESCPQGCAECVSADECLACQLDTMCDLTCPEGMKYDYERSRRCVDECDSLDSYESLRYKAGYKTPYCAYCGENCTECDQGTDSIPHICTECEGDLNAHFSGCVETCPTQFYDNGEICSWCGSNCLECVDNEICTLCDFGFKANNATGECDEVCPQGYLSESNECVPCADNCLKCGMKFENLVCSVCDKGYFLTPDNRCVTSCKDNGFVQRDHMTCAKTCGFQLDDKTLISIEGIDYNDNNKCKVCQIKDCSACFFSEFSGIEVCTSCGNKKFLQLDLRSNPPTKCIDLQECNGDYSPSFQTNANNVSTLTCELCEGYWHQPSKNVNSSIKVPTCLPCTADVCKQCAWDQATWRYKCLECSEGSFYDPVLQDCWKICQTPDNKIQILPVGYLNKPTPTCVSSCINGLVLDTTTNYCKECILEDCLSCSYKNGSPFCNQCRAGNSLDIDGKCVDFCQPGYGDVKGVCQKCSPGQITSASNKCITCSEIDPKCTECKTMDSNGVLSEKCFSCSDGLVVNNDGISCIQFQCPVDYPYLVGVNQCVKECPARTSPRNKVCTPCDDENCLTCQFDLDTEVCLECPSDMFIGQDGTCKDSCPQGIIPNTNKCKSCPSYCFDEESCVEYNGVQSCEACSEGLILVNGNCVTSCPQGYRYDEDANNCIKCGHNCLSCSESECLICQDDAYLNADLQTCTFGCPYQTFLKIIQNEFICDNCHQTCATCANTDSKSCTSCPPDLYLQSELLLLGISSGIKYEDFAKQYPVQGNCVKMCKTNTGPLGWICIPCPSNCLTCANDKCLRCDKDYWIDPAGKCQIDCFNAIPGCSECNNLNTCSKCADGFVLNGNFECDPICFPHQYIDKTIDKFACVNCHETCETCDSQTGQCLTCKAPAGEFRQKGFGMKPVTSGPNAGTCTMVKCYDQSNNKTSTSDYCQECQWSNILQKFECTLCYNNANDKFRLNEIGQCINTTCNENQYFSNNKCEACGSICNQCVNPQTCLNCWTIGNNILAADKTCRAECPPGYRVNKDLKCIKCTDNCAECTTLYAANGTEQFGQCMKCASGYFMLGNECWKQCTPGTYGDTDLGWCIRCACQCATCSGAKHQCTSCREGSQFVGGKCYAYQGIMPQAVMNEDWQSFTLTLYDSKYYLGYNKTIVDNEPIYTCQNQIFSQNWSSIYTSAQWENIYTRVEKMLSPIEKQYLSKIREELRLKYPNKTTSPAFYSKFLHNDETVLSTSKIFSYIANSLFGRLRSDVSLTIPSTALTSYDTSIANLCNIVFKGNMTPSFGSNATCNFVQTYDSTTRILVKLDANADYKSGMTLNLNPVFFRSQQSSNFLPIPIIESTIQVQPHSTRKFIDMDLKVNQLITQQLGLIEPIANCFSGIEFNWAETQNLCGKTLATIWIDTVRDSNGNYVTQFAQLVEDFNRNLTTDVAVNGKSNVYIVPSNMTWVFINYTLDFAVILSNCYPDKELYWVSVKMVDQVIKYTSIDGYSITFNKCPVRRNLDVEEEDGIIIEKIVVEEPVMQQKVVDYKPYYLSLIAMSLFGALYLIVRRKN